MSIVPLVKITAYGHQHDKEGVLADLQDMGCLHVLPLRSPDATPLHPGPSSKSREALTFLLSCPQRRRQVRDRSQFDALVVEQHALDLQSRIQSIIETASKDTNEDVRSAAQDVLQDIERQEQSVTTLVKDLSDDSWEVRADAARALAKRGTNAKPAMHSLIESIKAELARGLPAGGVVVVEATRALNAIGPDARDKAIEVLIEALQHNKKPLSRMDAAIALGELGAEGKAAIPMLKRALEDPEDWVRHSAAEALKKIQEP